MPRQSRHHATCAVPMNTVPQPEQMSCISHGSLLLHISRSARAPHPHRYSSATRNAAASIFRYSIRHTGHHRWHIPFAARVSRMRRCMPSDITKPCLRIRAATAKMPAASFVTLSSLTPPLFRLGAAGEPSPAAIDLDGAKEEVPTRLTRRTFPCQGGLTRQTA